MNCSNPANNIQQNRLHHLGKENHQQPILQVF